MENLFMPDSIRTRSGLYVNVFEPHEDMIDINDIAHALSMIPRFGGHMPKFYSVAQHCCLVSSWLQNSHMLCGLLHDSSEAYLMDIPSPIKRKLTNYKEIENGLMILIANKFQFQYPFPEEVKIQDQRMLKFEWNLLMIEDDQEFEYWTPSEAKLKFLKVFEELTKS